MLLLQAGRGPDKHLLGVFRVGNRQVLTGSFVAPVRYKWAAVGFELKGVQEIDMNDFCALNRTSGVYINSHLLPKAVTRPAVKGQPLYQLESGKKPIRRWDSWVDPKLVTQAGEDILTEYDTWAIAQLRKYKLVWSGWHSEHEIGHRRILPGNGIRRISGLDGRRLRLFFLSLLWRAAATSRPEFDEIEVEPSDLEQLRTMLVARECGSAAWYRIQLSQIVTKGEIHNHAPIAMFKDVKTLTPGTRNRVEKIFRFYFDGLIAHIHLPEADGDNSDLGSFVLGAKKDLVVHTVDYESSFQRENLTFTKQETITQF